MFRSISFAAVMMPLVAASAQTPNAYTYRQQVGVVSASCNGISTGPNGSFNGFVMSPTDLWHQDVSNAAVDPSSDNIMTNPADLGGYHLRPDFGTIYGIPYNVVDSLANAYHPSGQSQTVEMKVYPTHSDMTLYPVWPDAVVEGSPGMCPTDDSDRHLLIVDRHSCTEYELWQASQCNGAWSASNGAIFDMLDTEQRPYGMTSADAGGLSILEGLIRYDEIQAGVINHAIRFTAPHTKNNNNGGFFTAPATHAAGNLWGADLIMGTRIRLKSSFDISQYSRTNQIILTAMKKYGMILADNGGKLYFQGTTDLRWNDGDLINLWNVPSTALEVVKLNPVYDEVSAPQGAAPVISTPTVTPVTYWGATYYIIQASITGGSYSYMSTSGMATGPIFRGIMAFPAPAQPTTFTLTSRNLYGTTQKTIFVP